MTPMSNSHIRSSVNQSVNIFARFSRWFIHYLHHLTRLSSGRKGRKAGGAGNLCVENLVKSFTCLAALR